MSNPFNFSVEFEHLINRLACATTRLCSAQEAQWVVKAAQERFVVDSPRAWWLSLKLKPAIFPYPTGDGFQHLREHAPAHAEKCWLVLETETTAKPVAEIDILLAPTILGELPHIDYYLIDKDFAWLIIENDHNAVLVCSEP